MSPASSGALEVERYIGACLISSQTRAKGAPSLKSQGRDCYYQQRDQYVPPYVNNHHQHYDPQRCRSVDGWAGGMPLISFVNYQRRGKGCQDVRVQNHNNSLTRLAVHTQGAPLILSNRYNQRKNKSSPKHVVQAKGTDVSGKSKDGADTISVASDESSNSTNSENSLPRIIKPRKRRKKDRKPPLLARPLGAADDCFSTDSTSPDIDSPGAIAINSYLPFTFDQFSYIPSNNIRFDNEVLVNKLKQKTDLQEIPQLHHSFEDIKELSKDINDNQPASTCQCRYCDPSGQIWDVDRHCYSPFLTTPERRSVFSFSNAQPEPLIKNYDTAFTSDLLDCMSGLSLDSEGIKNDSSISGSIRDLEVSTEIVTSLNGHRDLEIKFFSSPSTAENEKRDGTRTRNLDKRCANSVNSKHSLDFEK